MAQRSLREFDSKSLLAKWVPTYTNNEFTVSDRFVQVFSESAMRPRSSSDASASAAAEAAAAAAAAAAGAEPSNKYASVMQAAEEHEWLRSERLVVKVDQLIKRRGKSGLLLLNATLEEAHNWIEAHMSTTVRG